MRYARMREMLEGPFLLTEEGREPRRSVRDRRRGGAIAPYEDELNWDPDNTDDVTTDAGRVPTRRRGSQPLPTGGG